MSKLDGIFAKAKKNDRFFQSKSLLEIIFFKKYVLL